MASPCALPHFFGKASEVFTCTEASCGAIAKRRLSASPSIVFEWSSSKGMSTKTRRIAFQRIQTLFRLAHEVFGANPILAQRYVDLSRRIGMAANVRLPKEYRLQVCRSCKQFILPGVNCRVRMKQRREPHIVITCFNCGNHTRIPLMKRRSKSSP